MMVRLCPMFVILKKTSLFARKYRVFFTDSKLFGNKSILFNILDGKSSKLFQDLQEKALK